MDLSKGDPHYVATLWSRWTETRDEGVKRKYNKLRNVVRGRSRKLEQKIQRDIANCSKTNLKSSEICEK